MLRITLDDGAEKVRLKLEGNLVGPWVAELEEVWQAAQSTLAGRSLSVDVTAVGHVDSAGKYLWHSCIAAAPVERRLER